MLPLNITLPTKSVSASAADGIAAVATSSRFGLTTTLDNSRTIRSNAVVGDIYVAHSPTKELGAPGTRHVVGANLKQNGSLPAAKFYLVGATLNSGVGMSRGMEAFNLLLSALFLLAEAEPDGSFRAGLSDLIAGSIAASGQLDLRYTNGEGTDSVRDNLYGTIAALLNSEG